MKTPNQTMGIAPCRYVAVLLFVLMLCAGGALAQDQAVPGDGARTLPLDINSEPAVVLSDLLPGIGPAKARAIVQYRENNGPFASVDDLLKVNGIGPSTLADIQTAVMVAPASDQASE